MRHSRILALGLLLAGMLTLGCSVTSSSSSEPLVETTSGIIAGDFHAGVFSFKGIPYAQAERFMPPQPPAAWEGVRQHTEFGPIAMQVNSWSPEEAMNEQQLFSIFKCSYLSGGLPQILTKVCQNLITPSISARVKPFIMSQV